ARRGRVDIDIGYLDGHLEAAHLRVCRGQLPRLIKVGEILQTLRREPVPPVQLLHDLSERYIGRDSGAARPVDDLKLSTRLTQPRVPPPKTLPHLAHVDLSHARIPL